MISPTRTSHASGLPLITRAIRRAWRQWCRRRRRPHPRAAARRRASRPRPPSIRNPSADSCRHTRKRAAKPRARHVPDTPYQPAFPRERPTGAKRHGANSTARPNAVANPLPASTACRSKRHHARDNESGQAQTAALINAAQTPLQQTPRQSRFYTRLTSLVKHGEFVSDLCYHQATSQEKFHTGNHLRNSHPIQLLGQRGHPFVPFVPCGEPDAAPALQQVRQTHTSLTWAIHDWHGLTCLFYTRLARSQLCRSYTKGTVKRIQTLLTWVFKLFQGTFSGNEQLFRATFLAKLQFS